ncbi:MAG: tetratricopeptide repeat protein, partial [bacterium]|nr:tetratricopeptide repeat protein [bacterium]
MRHLLRRSVRILFLFFSVLAVLSYSVFSRADLLEESFEASQVKKNISLLGKSKGDLLEDYQLYFSGRLAQLREDCSIAVDFFNPLVEKYSYAKSKKKQPSRWALLALRGLAEGNECLKETEPALRAWEEYAAIAVDRTEQGRGLYHAGVLADQRGETERAREIFKQLWLLFPEQTFAKQAEPFLKKLKIDSFSKEEQFKRGKLLYKEGASTQAREVFKNLDHSQASFWEAESLFRGKKYSEAREKYKALLEKKPSLSRKTEILFRIASASARLGERDNAIDSLKRILKISHSSNQMEARRKIAFLYFDAGDFEKANEHLKRLAHHSPRKTKVWAEEKLFWGYYRLGQWDEALKVLDDFENLGNKGQARYWKGRIYERQGKKEEAEKIWETLIQEDAWGYYTFLAADRLALTRKEILKRRDLREETKPSGKKSRKKRDETESACLPLERVKRLANLHLKEFVDAELAYARQVCPRHQVQTVEMARFGLKQDHYALAYSYAMAHDALNRGGELLRWAYPKAHPSFV